MNQPPQQEQFGRVSIRPPHTSHKQPHRQAQSYGQPQQEQQGRASIRPPHVPVILVILMLLLEVPGQSLVQRLHAAVDRQLKTQEAGGPLIPHALADLTTELRTEDGGMSKTARRTLYDMTSMRPDVSVTRGHPQSYPSSSGLGTSPTSHPYVGSEASYPNSSCSALQCFPLA
jgi:hypothetical protein